jgi:hypothetical protein
VTGKLGWTNGGLRRLIVLYPDAVAPPPGSRWCATANDNQPAAERGKQPATAR